jgi:hypothetical protein
MRVAVAGHPRREVLIGGRPAVGVGERAPVEREVDGPPQARIGEQRPMCIERDVMDREERAHQEARRSLAMRRPVAVG